MSTPPTPIINLDSPKEVYEADDCADQWTQDSTESAKNGMLQEWIREPLQMLTSASPTSSHSPNNECNAPSSTTEDVEGKNEFEELPALTGTSQLVSLTSNGQNRLAVSTSNGPSTMPATSNGYHQVYSALTTTSEFQVATSRTNGNPQQIPIPATSNGTNYGVYNYGVHYTGLNGVPGYAPNGVHIMNVRPPTQVVHPMRSNGGYNFNMPNGPNGYVHGMVNGRLVRPGWISTNKVVNGVKKQKRNRTAFTSHQMMELEQEYAKARYLDRTRRIELSETLNLNQRTIKIWFQNRRMKEKKDRLDEVTTSDSPENMTDVPIFLQDASFVPLGVENMQYNPGMYAESMPMSSMPPMRSPALSQPRQVPEPYMLENSIPVYNPVHTNGIQVPQPLMIPMNGNMSNATSTNAEENWDLSWIRSINITEEELA